MPFEAYCLTSDGTGVPCCAFTSNPPEKEKIIQKHNSGDIFELPIFKILQESFEKGELPPDPYCKNCIRKEKLNKQSYRKNYEQRRERTPSPFEKNILKHLDISFSNTCNLSCVMCNNLFSSKWNSLRSNFPKDLFLAKGNRDFDFTHSLTFGEIDELVLKCKSLATCSIKGGEPLYDKKTLYFLEKLSKVNVDVNIKIITNATIPNLKLLKKFKNIHMYASVDGTGKTYEYVRGWHDFQIVSDNVKEMVDNGLEVDILHTTSAWNLHNLKDCHSYFMTEIGVRDFQAFPAGGWAVSYDLLGEDVRNKLLEGTDHIQFMPGDFVPRKQQEINDFNKTTEILNRIRKMNWQDIFEGKI
jgi:sulfatase maturation enzyme AslB (radical SAM superfamily)